MIDIDISYPPHPHTWLISWSSG
ncbi:hypothetical protein CY0110_17057 [Crocosphaera chwakensis CCY0110]|uniref:Uncharacterized protein n=1 Tax=Crocosphaera chwakensis CCY0110 TaxID=391612 RepID=A3II93_9CHRO|nr:hypothetical protein CY0110_17057 [Crocosphaera chwakensis CCY0110]